MRKGYLWMIIIIAVLVLAGIVAASYGLSIYLAKKADKNVTPQPTASVCTSCREAVNLLPDEEEIKANHCLQNPAGGENITITNIAHYSQIESPITVSGTANVFEGSFTIRLVDCSGQEINKIIGQAEGGEVGESSPYSATLTYPNEYSGNYAYIEAYDNSMKDGTKQNIIQVPVLLK